MKSIPVFMKSWARAAGILLVLSASLTTVKGGQSKIGPFVGWAEISCCSSPLYTVEVENINPTFAIEGIQATFEIRKAGQLIHSQLLQGPPGARLTPGQKFDFQMDVPMAITALDALLDLKFIFDSNFDLNTDPTRSGTFPVTGCGIVLEDAIDYILDYIEEFYEDFLPEDAVEDFETLEDALVYYYPELIKPGTQFKDPLGLLVATMSAFSFMYVIDWSPFARFEKPVTILSLNTNTLEVEPIQMSWYPVVFDPGATQGKPFVLDPYLKQESIIRGTQPDPEPPPFPLTGPPVSAIPADSVCAILISGTDNHSALDAESFANDVQSMRRYLTESPQGPRLPENALLTLQGVGKDSLRTHLAALKDRYKKVYFYYSGHGSKSGNLGLGMSKEDWMTFQELISDLYDSNAKNLCIVLDCCYAGKIIQPACDDMRIKSRNIEIYTAADDQRKAGSRFHLENGLRVKRGVFTSQMFKQSLDETRDVNKDGKISLCETFDGVLMENPYSIRMLHNPQKKVELNAQFAVLAPIFQQAVVQMYGQAIADASNLRIFPELMGTGVEITSFDMETTITTPSPSYFGWIDLDPENLFGKPVEFVLVEGQTYTITVSKPAQFWPIITTMPGFDPFSTLYLIQDNTPFIFGPAAQTVHSPVPAIDPGDRVCALIVSGSDPRQIVRDGMSNSADIMRANMFAEEMGPRLPAKNIRVEKFISADSLRAILTSMQGKYDTVYFSYSGHGRNTGNLDFCTKRGDIISYTELLTALDAIGASENYVIIEACYSGLIRQALQNSGTFQNKHLEVYTSSNANKQSAAVYHMHNFEPIGYGAFGFHLMKCYGDPDAEKDGRPGASFKEAFEWVRRMNPLIPKGRLFQAQSPTYNIRGHISLPGSMPLIYDFNNLDLRIHVNQRRPSMIDVTADLRFDIAEKQTGPDTNIIAISPIRNWQLTGELMVDPSLAVDLEFVYDENMDTIYTEQGVLGLVWRPDDGSDWHAYYPSHYDFLSQTIVAENVDFTGEWAIARITDMSSSLADLSQVLSFVSIAPNPISEEQVFLHMNSDHAIVLQVELLLLNGEARSLIDYKTVKGEETIALDVCGLFPGMYFLRVTADGRTGSLPFVIR